MALFDKDRMMNGIGKAVDKVNEAADKAAQFAKEKEWDKKAQDVKNKTCSFVEEHELDAKAESVVGVIGTGLKKAGEGLEKAGANLEHSMKQKQNNRVKKDWCVDQKDAEEGTWRPCEDEKVSEPEEKQEQMEESGSDLTEENSSEQVTE